MPGQKSIRIKPEFDIQHVQYFVQNKIIPESQERDEKGEFSHVLVADMYQLGLLNLITPKEYGGPDLPLSDLIWVVRTISYGSVGMAATFVGNLLGYSPVVLYGKAALKEKICLAFQQNFKLWSLAVTERNVGSDLEKTATRAVKTKEGYVINGEKNFITNGTYATDISLLAQTYAENGEPLGISCFYISGETHGISRGAGEKKMGWRESNTGHLFLKDVFVPHENLLGQEGEGLQILSHCLNRSKTLMGAMGVGVCDRSFDITIQRLTETARFDKPLIEKHSIRHVIARLSVKVECAWLLVCQAAGVWTNQKSEIKDASMAKLFGGETATEVTSTCVELFGARGFLSEFEIGRLYRDAKALQIVEGPTLIQELLISRFVIKRSAKSSLNTNSPHSGISKDTIKKAA